MMIANAKYDDLPNKEFYSEELWSLIKWLIVVDPKFRIDIDEVLSTPIIRVQAKWYLSTEEF